MAGQRLTALATAIAASAGVAATLVAVPAHAAVTPTPTVDTATRAGAYAAYTTMYVPALAVAAGSTGNASTCVAGTTTQAAKDATRAVVNYYRSMVKLPAAANNTTWNTSAQAAALVQAGMGSLSHYPPSTAKCYTALGAQASGRSNLAAGYSTPGGAVDGYMDDSGNDSTLGHRRWILDPGMTQFGVGQVGAFNALQINNGNVLATPTGSPAYVAWPSAGYVPKALVPSANTWSFSASDAGVDMSAATVTVKSNGVAIPTQTVHLPNGYGKPAVEFKPTTGYVSGSDRAYVVTVSGMKKSGVALPAYTYTTTLFDERYSVSPQSITWTAPTYGYVGQAATLTAKATSGLAVTYASSTPSVCTVSGAKVTYVGAGTCSVTAKQAGNATWGAAAPVTRSIPVGLTTKKAQTITFTAPTGATNGGSATLTATASSGLVVAYTSGTPSVCTVSGAKVTYVNAGTCTVTALQAGNATYNAAPNVVRSFTVGGLKNNTIAWNPVTSVKVGSRATINPTVTSGADPARSATMSASGVCSFVDWSTLSFGAPGTCSVTLTVPATSTYKAATLTRTFTVS